MHCAKFGWNKPSGSGEEFFNFVNVFSLFRNYLPLEKGGVLHLNKLESPSPGDNLCQVWLKLTQWFWRRRFRQCIFHYFVISPSPKDALCQGWLKLAQWFWIRFFIFDYVFSLFHNYLPLEKAMTLHLNKLEFASLNNALFQVWLKIDSVVLEKSRYF